MKIASFGAAPVPGAEPLDFFSDARLAGFDAAIVDLEGALGAWLSRDDVWQAKAERVLTLAAHQRLVETLERRARELRKFIDEGLPAVLFPAVLPSLKHVDKKGRFTDFELDSNLYPATGIARAGNDAPELRGPPELLAFGERLGPTLKPHATLPKHIGAPAFLLDGKVAGAFLCDGKRWVLTCPRLADASDLAAAFAELYRATSAEAKLPDLPPWHEQYLIPGEAQMAVLVEKIEKGLAEILALRDQKLAEKAELGYLKRLFTDEGPSLRHAAAVALKAMGFDVQPGPRGKDELVITLGQAVAIVATKGRTGPASEADAVDLDKAVHRHFKEHNVMPKGILVFNSFRDLPLHDRREATFPPAMHGYAKNRGHCLITGLQLLCLSYEGRHPDHGPRARNELLHTVGPFQRFRGGEWAVTFGAGEDRTSSPP
jgi:hypothetical protein